MEKRYAFLCVFAALLLTTVKLNAQAPLASFTADIKTGCAPLSVNFTNTSTGANSYSWNLGNTNTSTVTNPSTIYLSPGNYTVTLTATNTVSGQSSTITHAITVVNNPVSDFTFSPAVACEDQNSICFTNTSQFAATYVWDFGDGNSSTAVSPCYTYTSPGTYTVKLIAFSAFGCSDLEIKTNIITIHPKPVVNFTSNIQSTCNVTDPFNFTANAPGANSWSWNFGDFTTSALQNPSHTYGASGTYTVTLIATNSFGCVDTAKKINYINIGASLVPSFTLNDSGGCAPFTVNFNCNVPNALTWSWNFGNGNTSTLQSPSNTYTVPGNYNITLSVTTQSGCNGSVTVPALVVVDPLPVPSFTVVQDTGCSPFTPVINNTSTGATTYQWSTNSNSQTSTQTNPTFTYTSAGPYNLTLTAYSPNGCPKSTTVNNSIYVQDPSAAFTGAPLFGCPGMTTNFTFSGSPANITTWLWSFGDGTFSGLQNPSHTYSATGNYTVWLIVTNSFGCKDTVYKSAYIKIYPATIPYTADTIKVCQTIPQAFYDPKLGNSSWTWNFGDGTTSNIKDPTHTYNVAGTFIVSLVATMAGGCSQTFNPLHVVQVIPYSPKPVTINYISRCKPYTVGFSNSASNITGYLWDFGDSTTSTQTSPVHIYASAGTYTVTTYLTVGSGCQHIITNTVKVGNSNPMKIDSMNICLGSACNFTMLNPATFVAYQWNFGDFTTSLLQNPSHAYASAGSFNVKLITTDTIGCIDTFKLGPVVVNNPIANFSIIGPTAGCNTLTVTLQNNSTGAAAYSWDFGNGQNSVLANPTVNYTSAGNYSISLTATINGCSNTKTQNNIITVVTPLADFSFNTNSMCLPVTATFTDMSANPVSWLWDFGDGTTSTLQNPVHVFNSAPTGPITLTITDIYNCTATISKTNINYYNAIGSVNVTTGCRPLTATFTNQSVSSIGWSWNFGDGNTSTLQNPSHVYTIDGNFNVTLIATFPGGCIDTAYYPALVTISTPIPDFTAPSASGCSPVNMSFTNTSTDGVSFLWDFGDGTTSTSINPNHIYNIPGYYDVSLVATNSNGCSDTMTKIKYIIIPGVYSAFGISSSSGCDTLPAIFIDSSINASTWIWNFGDGNTSLLQNPTHTYLDTGSYVVSLVTHDTLGCTSIYTYPVPIEIHQSPTAMATTTDIEGCASYTVSFTNQSLLANNYQWDFGNGATSSAANPTYTYTTPGTYYPSFIATNNFGCIDTFTFSTPIIVHAVPTVSFTPTTFTVCNPDTITFINNSSNLENPNFSWNYGNGVSSTDSTGGVMYTDSGVFAVTLYVVNTFGCTDSNSLNVTVHAAPVAAASTNDTLGCSAYTASFINSSAYSDWYYWDFGDGDTSTASQPSHTYQSGGVYQPVLIASNNYGCTDTFTLANNVTVLQTPKADFNSLDTAACFNTPISFVNNSSNLLSPSYLWNFGFINSIASTPVITFPGPGTYDVSLLVTNNNGCVDSINVVNYIDIYDTIPPAPSVLLSVSVVNDNAVDVTWQNNPATDLGAYEVYRYDPLTTLFNLVYTDNSPVNFVAAPTSTYQDAGLDTKNNTYTYLVKTIDRCGYAIPLNPAAAHTTINVTAIQAGININVSWTPYGGCGVSTYDIIRREVLTGNTQLIANVPSNVLNYTDTTLTCPFAFSYLIKATDLCGQSYISYSDTSAATPLNPLAGQHVDVVRSTVVNDKEVMTEWLPPVLHAERVKLYNVLRSTDNVNFTSVALLPPLATSYTDNNVNVKEQNYYFKIEVINDCDMAGPVGQEGSSILLQGEWRNFLTKLRWTKYEFWNNGVDHYTIQKLNNNGVWEDYLDVDGNTTNVQVNE